MGLWRKLGSAIGLTGRFGLMGPAGLTLVLAVGVSLHAPGSSLAQPAASPSEYARQDPMAYVSAERCGECHVAEHQVWKRTPHATGFKTLHRKESAEVIVKKLGFRLVKRDSVCIRCHYTPELRSDELRALSGVSCESCHGAARDWLTVHNNYGGGGADYQSESPQHRAQRIEDSRRAGMRRSSDLYPVAASCFECHMVPEERLVNVGGHTTGSGNFEFVKWSQGEIRHNFLAAQRGGSGENVQRPIERKRVMYVVGRALELEYSLRGVAAATEKGIYLKAMQRRNRNATAEVREIASRAELPEIQTILEVVRGVNVGFMNRAALLGAADKIGEATQRFLNNHDGTRLDRLDPLVSGTAEPAVEELEEPPTPTAGGGGEGPGGEAAGDATTRDPDPATPSPSPAGDSRAATPGRRPAQAVGEIKTSIRPRSRNRTLGGACSGCHAPQNEWWFEDAHYESVEPFFDEEPKNVQIARLYGIRPADMTKGNQVCMDCHGTIVTGKERRDVQDGVGCESCHGASEKFLEPHQEGDKALGENRPGYINALQLGMVKLKDLTVRARTCTGCHYITEPRLISAGHPSGADFDYVGGMSKIQHWEHPVAAGGALKRAFDGVLASRGAVPDVPRATAGGGSSSTPTRPGATPDDGGRAATSDETTRDTNPVWVPPPKIRPVTPRSVPDEVSESAAEELPPFPQVDESTSVEEILLILKRRLELLHQKVYPQP